MDSKEALEACERLPMISRSPTVKINGDSSQDLQTDLSSAPCSIHDPLLIFLQLGLHLAYFSSSVRQMTMETNPVWPIH